jgi:hypothetical protein
MSKQEPTSEKFISPIIDHKAYQEMLRELGILQAKGTLLHIRAIDAPQSVKDRDGTMCSSILVALDSGRYDSLVVLVGNIHGIKSIAWAPEVSHNPQYLAGRLIQEGVKVFTVMQYWGEETEQPRLISTTTPQGEVLAMKVMDPVNHSHSDASNSSNHDRNSLSCTLGNPAISFFICWTNIITSPQFLSAITTRSAAANHAGL